MTHWVIKLPLFECQITGFAHAFKGPCVYCPLYVTYSGESDHSADLTSSTATATCTGKLAAHKSNNESNKVCIRHAQDAWRHPVGHTSLILCLGQMTLERGLLGWLKMITVTWSLSWWQSHWKCTLNTLKKKQKNNYLRLTIFLWFSGPSMVSTLIVIHAKDYILTILVADSCMSSRLVSFMSSVRQSLAYLAWAT